MRPRGQPRPTPHYERRAIRPDETYVAFRLVRSDVRDSDAFTDSFRSRAALGLPPRTYIGENDELADGISAFTSSARAEATARAALDRGRDLGGFVAETHLREGCDIAEWGSPGHLTVWGNALILASQVVDIVPIGA